MAKLKRFGKILKKLNIPVPKYGIAFSINDAIKIAKKINYPVLVRPSYVLGGRGMEIVYDEIGLKTYVGKAALVSGDHPILIDAFFFTLNQLYITLSFSMLLSSFFTNLYFLVSM